MDQGMVNQVIASAEHEKPKKYEVEVIYNGVTKPIEANAEEHVTALLQRAITTFGITQNQHLLSLYRQDGSQIPENVSVQDAGIKPGEVLLLRPNAVKGGGDPLQLAHGLLEDTFSQLRACGHGACECVVYWLGPSDASVADRVEHPKHLRSRGAYEVDDGWLHEFSLGLSHTKRSVKAQIHTHPAEAFHSLCDDMWPIVSQPRFLSIVIPNFACGPADLDRAWLGVLDENGMWQEVRASEVVLL